MNEYICIQNISESLDNIVFYLKGIMLILSGIWAVLVFKK